MAKAGDTTTRLLRLITMIQGDRRWRAPALAEALGVDTRSVHRYLKTLRKAGVPIACDRQSGGGYFIRGGFFLPPMDLTTEEALALVLLAERVAGSEQLPLTRPAATAIEKLRGGLPAKVRDLVGEILPTVTVRLAAAEGEGIEAAWSRVSQAIAERRTLRCEYEPAQSLEADSDQVASPPREPFDFDPYHLCFQQRAWYVVGYHHRREALRTLRLSRFASITPQDRYFDVPSAFHLDDYFGQAWRMIPGDRVRRAVAIRFDAGVADTVEETRWHTTQQIEHHDDGSITARFEIDGLDEIVWWVLGYGPHAEVVEPVELRERIRELVKATARRYPDGGLQ